MNFINNDILYFRVKVEAENVVLFVSILRSIEDNLAFDRVEDKVNSVFEFFVTNGMRSRFYEIIDNFKEELLVEDYWQENIENSSLFKYK